MQEISQNKNAFSKTILYPKEQKAYLTSQEICNSPGSEKKVIHGTMGYFAGQIPAAFMASGFMLVSKYA